MPIELRIFGVSGQVKTGGGLTAEAIFLNESDVDETVTLQEATVNMPTLNESTTPDTVTTEEASAADPTTEESPVPDTVTLPEATVPNIVTLNESEAK
jgi:hypothetical protein